MHTGEPQNWCHAPQGGTTRLQHMKGQDIIKSDGMLQDIYIMKCSAIAQHS
jgi:hypothetical protein